MIKGGLQGDVWTVDGRKWIGRGGFRWGMDVVLVYVGVALGSISVTTL